ncbi:MAG: site-specific DNA-methyltransferase, partial [Methylococcales bacterium]
QYEEYDEEYKDRFKYEDDFGKYRWQVMATYSEKRLNELKANNMMRQNPGSKYPEFKQYLHELKGRPIQDIWSDINMINAMGGERLDYPTQKPESLIERIISASTNKGGIVLDCFMGSGTTQSVAMKLGRRFIGADINLGAIQTTTKRLLNVAKEVKEIQDDLQYYTGVEVYNVNHYDVFRNPVEAKDLLIEALEIDKLDNGIYDGEKDGYKVKVMPVNRIATREDLNELLYNFPTKVFEKRKEDAPNKPVESIMLVCMGHEPDLKAHLEQESGYKLDVKVVDILRDKANIEFKRDSEARISTAKNKLVVENFYPMNLLQKLSLQKESVEEWRELVETIMIDWNYDGAVMEPSVVDTPDKNDFVAGEYDIPADAGTIKIKITDLLSESYEEVIHYG